VLLQRAAFLFALVMLAMPAAQSAEKLTPERIANLIPQIFTLHLSKKEMNEAFMRQLLKEFVNQLDPAKSLFLKDEAEAVCNKGGDELRKLAERSLNGDFSAYTDIVKSFLDKQIARDTPLYDGLENRAADIKALLEDKPKEKTAANGDEKASKEDEDEDIIKLADRPANLAERETRLLKTCAALFRLNKSYLSESEAMKQSLLTVREEHKKWMGVKLDEEVPKLFLKSFMTAMDPHTVYFDPEEDEEFVARLERSFAGIGVQIRPCPLGAQVEDVMKGYPAEKSGRITRGDQIVRVGDEVLAGLPINKVVRRIKGKKGTEVALTILKREGKATEMIKLVRDDINLAELRVKGKTYDTPGGLVGVISVQTFYQGVHKDVKTRIEELNKEKPLAGMVLDLRENHGGYLEEAVGLAGLFIGSGPVVGERDGRGNISWKDDPDSNMVYGGPLVVLVNQFSASASEIVAGTLKDYGRAVIVGSSQTFGKGTVQRVIPLSIPHINLPGEIKITTHQYYLAGGASVQIKGVEPDVQIPGMKLMPDLLEKANENAVQFDRIKPKPEMSAEQVQAWTEWKAKHVSELRDKSEPRTERQEYKDAFDIKKLKAKRLALEQKKASLKPDEAPTPEDPKKDEPDMQALEAAAIVGDMIPGWPKQLNTQAAK
jgi:carboxyl-terminal processing protease